MMMIDGADEVVDGIVGMIFSSDLHHPRQRMIPMSRGEIDG